MRTRAFSSIYVYVVYSVFISLFWFYFRLQRYKKYSISFYPNKKHQNTAARYLALFCKILFVINRCKELAIHYLSDILTNTRQTQRYGFSRICENNSKKIFHRLFRRRTKSGGNRHWMVSPETVLRRSGLILFFPSQSGKTVPSFTQNKAFSPKIRCTFFARCTLYVRYMYSICTLLKRTNTVHIAYI